MKSSVRQSVGTKATQRPERPHAGVAIVGLGNWGSSLARALPEAGVPVTEIVVRARGRRRGVLELSPLVRMAEARLDAAVVWICVPDSSIAKVAEEIVRRRADLRGQVVVHSSGALTVEALEAAARAGAGLGSIHPVMSFPTRDPVPLGDVLFGVEAEPSVRRRLFALVRSLGGRPFAIDSNKKALYHAAGTMASPLLVSALSAAVGAARAVGLSAAEAHSLIAPLAQASVRNYFECGPEKSFSGPLARGDAATIDLHRKALEAHPILADVYQVLALHALEALPVVHRDELQKVLTGERRKRGRE